MVFVVSRMEIRDPAGTHVATSDSRMVIRERPEMSAEDKDRVSEP
jgi:hypothetical protein